MLATPTQVETRAAAADVEEAVEVGTATLPKLHKHLNGIVLPNFTNNARIVFVGTLNDNAVRSNIYYVYSNAGDTKTLGTANYSAASADDFYWTLVNGRLVANSTVEFSLSGLDEYVEIIDIMKREELAVLNTISTAEGTIEIAIANTNRIIHGSRVLILGFGRIGKVLARKMAGLSAKVTCAARKDEDLAWIRAYGHNETNINIIGENLKDFDIIINTVPHLILNKERLQYVKEDCLLIDLASNPGGIDKKEAKARNLKLIWALALPRKSCASYNC